MLAKALKEKVSNVKEMLKKGETLKSSLAASSLTPNQYYSVVNAKKTQKAQKTDEKPTINSEEHLRRFVSLLSPKQVIEIIRSH